jgi:signal transduction histidine kinase
MPFDGLLAAKTHDSGADRLAALHLRTGRLAHDFNNLLNVILNANEALAATLPEGSQQRELAEVSQAAAEKGAELLRQLLDGAEGEAGGADCGEALAEAARLARLATHDGVRIATRVAAGPLRVAADRGGLENALMNLCVNAGHAMPTGGAMTLSAEAADLGVDEAEALGVEPGRYAVLAVQDTGVGMSPETLARALEPFFTTRAGRGGTGLGLAGVHDFAREAGGAVELRSALGQGATARLYLPLTA